MLDDAAAIPQQPDRPVPLVAEAGAWRFDTDAGIEEILDRRIGEHELAAVELLRAYVEPSLAHARPDDKFQFERNGYFVADLKDHRKEMPVFNLAVTLRDSWTASK